MDVAVIIPCKNHADLLRWAVMSCGNVVDEVWIINDNSTDHTLDVAREMQRLRPGVFYRFVEFNNVVKARNIAIEQTTCELIIPLDADDWLLPGAITKMKSAYKPGTFVYGGYHIPEEAGYLEVQAPPPTMINRKNITQATMLYAKSDWQMAGKYDVDFMDCAEDWALTCALIAQGVAPVRLEIPLYVWTKGERHLQCKDKAIQQKTFDLLRAKYPTVFGR